MVSGLPNWLRLWTILRQNQLRCWTFPEDVGSKMPVFNMTLTEVGASGACRRCCDMHVRRRYYVCLICTSKTLETIHRRCTYSMAGDIGGQNSKHEKNKMLVEVKFGSVNVVGYNVIRM